ncbi:MAG: hypothetical protein COB59_02875, partial [Rhodospirillaceae bacterium]
MTKIPTSKDPVEFIEGRAKAVTDAESLVLKCIKTGKLAKIPGDSAPTDPDSWSEAQTIRAEFIRHICLNPEKYKMDPGGIQIKGARISGELNLEFATLSQPLVIISSHITQAPKLNECNLPTLMLNGCDLPGLQADGMNCKGAVFLENIHAHGVVHLVGAKIGGDLICQGSKFSNEGDEAFRVDRLKCTGTVFLANIIAQGEVRMAGAKIGGNLEFQGATLSNQGGHAFSAERLFVKGRFVWCKLKKPIEGSFNLMHAHVGDLIDDVTGWPKPGLLEIDGFTYDNLGTNRTVDFYISWLDLMPKSVEHFRAQPYEQLIKVLHNLGHEAYARRIAVAKEDAYRANLKEKVKHA